MNTYKQSAEEILRKTTQKCGKEQTYQYLGISPTITEAIDAVRKLYQHFYAQRTSKISPGLERKEYWQEFVTDLETRTSSLIKQLEEEIPDFAGCLKKSDESEFRTQMQYRQRKTRSERNPSTKRGRR